MIALQSLTQLPDGRFYAKWFDSDDESGLGQDRRRTGRS